MSPPPPHQQQQHSPCVPSEPTGFHDPMHLFHKTLSAPSSSSSSTASCRVTTSNSIDKRPGQSSSFTERRLTRQRKLRHATDEDLGLNFLTDVGAPPSPPPPHPCHDRYRSCSAVPLPLPLPESPMMARRRTPESSCSHPAGGQPEACSPAATRSPPSRGKRAMSHDRQVGFHSYDLSRLHIPARSAPTSGVSTPNVSPGRPASSGNRFFFFNHRNSHDDPNRMAKPNSAPTSGFTTPTSPDHSPLHSPDVHGYEPCVRPKKGEKFQPSFGCQASAHPLPRPPSPSPSPAPASVPSQTAVVPLPPRAIVHRADGGAALWQKGRLIGRGTYGSVYHGTHRLTGASCAIKEVDLIPDDSKSTECVKQLEQEINVLSQLEHPNIVQYYGSEIVGDHFNIYLEYVHPGSLSKYVHEHCGNMTESIIRNFTRHILSGLAYLHSRKTIHRDIKGANLLVDQSGTVKLADFGMAKHLTCLSSQLSLKGSPHWMAPEVIKAVMRNESNPDLACAVDIWSLGCTIIEMFTGKPPWGDLEGPQAMFKVLNRSPAIPENLSAEGKDFLCLCFRRDPAERPSASILLEHSFVRICDDLTVSINFSGTNCTDKSQNPSYRDPRETDWLCGPTSTQITSTKLQTTSGRAQSLTRASCHRPSSAHHCSMVEAAVPSPSGTQPIPGLQNFSSSNNIYRLLSLDSANNHPLSLSRTRGREVPHI